MSSRKLHPAQDNDQSQASPYKSDAMSQSAPQRPIPGYSSETTNPPHARPRLSIPQTASPTVPAITDAATSMPPPTTTSPRPRSVTPAIVANFRPTDRSLPSRDVTEDTLLDAFVAFILYCNPNFPLDTDTTALREAFLNAPRSEGKDVDMFRLYELLRALETKEIKTWHQLAMELGVEGPDSSKGQSSQKVQQYMARLKRWMNALHVHAFYEYLMGKSNAYFTEIPHPSDAYAVEARAGVKLSEDLALRALDPTFRPKRGRRRNSDADQDDAISPGAKAPRYSDGASTVPNSAIPSSAHPDNFQDPWSQPSASYSQHLAPWAARFSGPASAASASSPANLRWQHNGGAQTPSTPHPMSAHIDAAFDGEPKSAITPSSRKRKRHGPAVSSAWTSTSMPGAKPRGRPPANRNVQDGPFSTFPADPANDTPNDQLNSAIERPSSAVDPPALQPAAPITTPLSAQSEGNPGRGQRLSLTVPQKPLLLVNGEKKAGDARYDPWSHGRATMTPQLPTPQSGQSIDHARGGMGVLQTPQMPTPQSGHSIDASRAAMMGHFHTSQIHNAGNNFPSANRSVDPPSRWPGLTFEALKRAVASDLLRADVTGRKRRLSGEEARRLADAVLDRLGVSRTGAAENDIACFTAAAWLGVSQRLAASPNDRPLGSSAAEAHGKRIKITRYRTDAHGYEEVTSDEESSDEDPRGNTRVRKVFDLSWNVGMGICHGAFEMKNITLMPSTSSEGAAVAEQPPISDHDLVWKRAVATIQDLRDSGWIAETLRDVVRATRPSSEDDNLQYKAQVRMYEFTAGLARGLLQREKAAIIQRVSDALVDL